MTDDPILERVQAIVARIAGPGRTPHNAGPDTPLGEEGFWLDSLDLLDVIVACESEFGTVLDQASGLGVEALESARNLAQLIRMQVDTR